jgi:2-polyprenyl-3-methyl-5-hydroxy-6-metoxy-1,4-benzoquinol methylase
MARLSFALRMATQRWSSDNALCPYCDSRFADILQRKWLLIEARRCLHCGLIFRWPTDATEDNRKFYETDYEGQQATDVPDAAAAATMAANDFTGTPWHRGDRVRFIERALGKPDGRTLLDFGCSWGYATQQYKAAGWRASGYEIDRRRAEFGRVALGLDIKNSLAEYSAWKFDVILADHSFEHVPRLGDILETWVSLAAPDAVLVVFVPNGSCRDARRLGVGWGPFIGEAHTVAFTMEWFIRNLPRHGFHAEFRRQDGVPLREGEYLDDCAEICMVARTRSPALTGA